MQESGNKTVRIGPFTVTPGAGTIAQGSSEQKVSPRSMEVLLYLAEHAERIVTTDELLDRFWSSVASDHAIHKAIAELRAAMGDNVRRQRYIRTVPKRGYKLQIALQNDTDAPPAPSRIKGVRDTFSLLDLRPLAVGACASLVLMSLLWLAINQRPAGGSLVIGVPPLRFESNGIETNRYLVDGLTSTLINDLSMLDDLSVVALPARAQTSLDAPRPVSHVLQGTLIQAQERLRVLVNLVRTRDGVHEYSGRFDLSEADLFTIQDTIVNNIVAALEIHLDAQERARMHDWGTQDAMAYDRFMKGEFHSAQFNPVDWELAMAWYEEALALDPGFVNAWLGLAAAANNLSVYARLPKKQALIEKVAGVHRAVAAMAREHDALQTIRAIEMRMAGTEYRQEEVLLRQQILSGNPPAFAMAHYAQLLLGARLYKEAAQFLDKAAAVGPFEISPDEMWSYRIALLPPTQAIEARKQELLIRPKHVGFLGAVARDLAVSGDLNAAAPFLERQRQADSEGVAADYTRALIEAWQGRLPPDSDAFAAEVVKGQEAAYGNGVLSFVHGDVALGAQFWNAMHPLQKRWLLLMTHTAERNFPAQVLDNPAYHEVLEGLDVGVSWQRTLMEGVMVLERVTGVALSDTAWEHYQQGRFMSRNNLWGLQETGGD
jgi:DNA-binding winged helix-turn-helix (wHTH) protein/TolB-like protein/tetratricopeptide (TPR) repeat protein